MLRLTAPDLARIRDVCGWAWVATVGLMAWGWFPPLPYRLHDHMQWSDVAFGTALLPWSLTKPWHRVPAHVTAPLAAWLALGMATALTRGTPAKLLGSAMLVLLMLMTADMAREADWRERAVRATVLSSAALAVLGVVGFVLFYLGVHTPMLSHPGDLQPGSYPRIRSATFLPNILGSYAIFASATCFLPPPGAWRRVGWGASLLAAILSISRGLLGIPVVLGWMFARGRIRWAILGATFSGLLFLSVVNLRLDVSRPWDASLGWGGGTRRHAAVTSLETVGRFPLLGCGLDCRPGRWKESDWDAHNTLIQIAATRGLPALAAFLWLLWRVRSRPMAPAVAAGLVALLVDGMAQDVEDFRHLWVALGLALATEHAREVEVLDSLGGAP